MVVVGEAAPDFTLDSDDRGPITLTRLRGRKVVLYFYPKDDTPGCTIQACDFRDSFARFDEVNVMILGVSPDSVESHRSFREKFALTFPLLADVGAAVSERYGVMKGGWIVRSTFLVDEDGIVEGVWRDVNATGHMEMLAELLGA